MNPKNNKHPNFFIVGAPKCGTTAIADFLDQHPDIYIAWQKEACFFGSDLHRKINIDHSTRLKLYLDLFKDVSNEKIIGEASVMYLISEKSAVEIKEFDPNAKILIMVRNPVDMMYSHHSQLLYNLDEDVHDFAKALELESERRKGNHIPKDSSMIELLFYSKLATYTPQIKRYFNTFGRENVHVIIFDDFKKNNADTYKETLNFLDVTDDFLPEFSIVNPNKINKSDTFHRYIKYPPTFIKSIKNLIPWKLRVKIRYKLLELNRDYTDRKPLDSNIKKILIRRFISDIDQLSELLGKDLSFWYKEN